MALQAGLGLLVPLGAALMPVLSAAATDSPFGAQRLRTGNDATFGQGGWTA